MATTISSTARWLTGPIAALALLLAACGSGGEATGAAAGADRPTVVVTTNILSDVVAELVGDQANVVTVMPVGADPHEFQPSAQEIDQLLAADALIANGSGFEAGLLDVIESARDAGVPTHEAIDAVEAIELGPGGHHENESGHDDEPGHDGDGSGRDEHHDDDGRDPHFFTDPVRMADAVEGIGRFLAAEVPDLDPAALDDAVDDYVAELAALDAEVERLVEAIPEDRRILVTNHAVFGYFADRYGFELVGTVIPSGTTADAASAGDLAELAEIIEAEGVPAIFADTSSSNQLVDTLASEVGGIEVVALYSESLGQSGSDGATYIEMVRTNASRISAALG